MRLGSSGPLSGRAAARGRVALGAFARRSDDRRLERTIGGRAGLRIVFGALARRFDPAGAEGFTGALQFELLGMDGRRRSWMVEVGATAARSRPGTAPDAALVVKLGLADFARLVAGDLDPGKALLMGRLDVEGDVNVALRLGPMFGLQRAL